MTTRAAAPQNFQPIDALAPATLDHEKLVVYTIALEFHALAAKLVPTKGHRELRDQLERASLSIVLTIAEGAGRTSPQDKRHFYSIARGSTTECSAVLDVLRVRTLISQSQYEQARGLLVRIVQMLSRLCGFGR